MDYLEDNRGVFGMAYILAEMGLPNISKHAFLTSSLLADLVSGMARCAYRVPFVKILDELMAELEHAYWVEEARNDSAAA